MRVVKQVAGKVWQLRDDFAGDFGVPLRRDENAQAGRGKQRTDKVPRYRSAPRPRQGTRMRCHPQKLVNDRPSRLPGIGSNALALEPVATGRVKERVGVGGVHQDVGVDGEH